jgi:membrane fusion protein, multidrug efflux system
MQCSVIQRFSRDLARAFLLSVVLFAPGCKKETPPPAPRVVDVTAVTIQPRDTPAVFEFPGQTQSSREVEIRARVDGFLEKRLYTEGNLVKAGETLFIMDQKPFQAALQQARGELAQQQARLQVGEANLSRVKPLAEQNAVSRRDLDDAVGNEKSARAAVLTAEGSVRQAELNLSYTTITSPLTGLSSFAKIQEGAYVNASNNLLTTVAQLDPIWVNFSISENEHLRFREEVAKGELKTPPSERFEIEVVLGDGSVFQNRGRISFADPSFSKDTGTFLVRATLANPQGILRPGQFVRVRVLGATRPNAILVPQRAIQQGAKSHFVWVVGKEGKAEQRAVQVGQWSGDDWVINEGLRAGEQIVVDGAIRVAPGASLKVTEYKTPAMDKPPSARETAGPTAVEKAASSRK